jgi:hypothetical protein
VESSGKASLRVKWERGELAAGEPTRQSSMSLAFWTALKAAPPSDEENDDEKSESDLEERD